MELCSIFVQVTTACNARCITCPHPFTYGRTGTNPKGRMPPAVWDKIVSDVAAMGFAGGMDLYMHCEPFLDPGIAGKVRDVNTKTRAHVVLSTNGSVLSEDSMIEIMDSPPRRIHVNINSGNPEQYARMTGLDLGAVILNTKRLIELAEGKTEVEINCPVVPETDTAALVALFPGVKVNTEFWANSRAGLLPDVSTRNRRSRFTEISSARCTLPRTSLNILTDGGILICCMDWEQHTRRHLPNVMDHSLRDIHEGPELRDVQGEFDRGDYSRFPMCARCADEMGYRTTADGGG